MDVNQRLSAEPISFAGATNWIFRARAFGIANTGATPQGGAPHAPRSNGWGAVWSEGDSEELHLRDHGQR